MSESSKKHHVESNKSKLPLNAYGILFLLSLKNPKLYVNLRLENDSDEGFLTDTKDDLNTIYKEDFNFIIMDKDTEKLIIGDFQDEVIKVFPLGHTVSLLDHCL